MTGEILYKFAQTLGVIRRLPGSAAVWVGIMVLTAAAVACGGAVTEREQRSSTVDPSPTDKVASVGDAPLIDADTYSHGRFDLTELGGQPVVINFWFPSCPPCRAEMPDLQAAYEEFKGRGVNFVGVQQLGLDSEDAGREFLEEVGVNYPNIGDQAAKLQLAYKVLSYPTTVFLDRSHNVAKRWDGIISEENLREQILNVLES